MSDLPMHLHARAVDQWLAVVAQVPDDAWSSPTPCTDWSVRDLVNHLVSEDLWAVELVGGASLAEVGDRFDGDQLGADPIGAADAAGSAAAGSVAAASPDGTVELSFGVTPVPEYVAQLTADHLVHTWDLAAATGQRRGLDPELVEAVAGWFVEREDGYRGAGVIGPRGASAGDPQGDLLAAFGRDAAWEPSA